MTDTKEREIEVGHQHDWREISSVSMTSQCWCAICGGISFDDGGSVTMPRDTATRTAQGRDECQWTEDEDGNWDTECNQKHILISGTPSDNYMEFCCYCGKKLKSPQQGQKEGM